MGKENPQGTLLHADAAEGAFSRIDDIDPVSFENGLRRANLFTTATLIADMDLKNPGDRKLSFDMDGRFLGIILFKMTKSTD